MRKKIMALLLLVTLTVSTLARAESTDVRSVVWPEYGFSLKLPACWIDAELALEAMESGVFYAAQTSDGRMTLILRYRRATPDDARTEEAHATHCARLPGVKICAPVEAGGQLFLLARERCNDGAEDVLYRVASAVIGENRLEMIFIDRTGGIDETPLAILTSYQRLPGGEAASLSQGQFEQK